MSSLDLQGVPLFSSCSLLKSDSLISKIRCGGWSLIELLVVLFIVGTLATLVIPSLVSVTSKAERMASHQLLLETLASVRLVLADQGLSVEQACDAFVQQEKSRFSYLNLNVTCRLQAPHELLILADSDGAEAYRLSSIHGFSPME